MSAWRLEVGSDGEVGDAGDWPAAAGEGLPVTVPVGGDGALVVVAAAIGLVDDAGKEDEETSAVPPEGEGDELPVGTARGEGEEELVFMFVDCWLLDGIIEVDEELFCCDAGPADGEGDELLVATPGGEGEEELVYVFVDCWLLGGMVEGDEELFCCDGEPTEFD